jgi:glycine cleavage system aminomethyltransferase T
MVALLAARRRKIPDAQDIDSTPDGTVRAVTASPPTWRTARDALGVVTYGPHLRRTIAIALVVGTVLFAINQLDVVLRGDATKVVWIKSAITYLVPFGVSNFGVLVASRRSA